MDLTKIKNDTALYQGNSTAIKKIDLYYAGDILPLDSSLVKEYSNALETTHFSNCTAEAKILANVAPADSANPKSAWSIGAAFIPLWPALPVNEVWTFELRANVICNEAVTHKIRITEHEHVEAFFYGAFRVDLINDAASAMHKKLIMRLQEELEPSAPKDFSHG